MGLVHEELVYLGKYLQRISSWASRRHPPPPLRLVGLQLEYVSDLLSHEERYTILTHNHLVIKVITP